MDQNAQRLLQTSDALFNAPVRVQMLNLWQNCAEIYYPERADFTRVFNPIQVIGENMESTPATCRRDLANYISLFRENFKIRTLHEDIDQIDHVAKWLDAKAMTLKRAMADKRTQYKRALKSADNDYVTFGNAVIAIEESPTRDHLLFRNYHLRDCAWMENEIGVIDRLDRKMKMTARNMLAKFKDQCPDAIKRACETEPTKEFEVRHIVMPADEYDPVTKKKAKAPFLSIYIDASNNAVLKTSYLKRFLYVVARWLLISGCVYGFSPPAIGGLPDGRMIQDLARIILEAGEKTIDPPTAIIADALRSDANLYAGGQTVIDADYDERTGPAIRQIQTMGDIRLGVEIREDVRKLLNDAWYLSKLFLPNEREMTAEEANLRNQEFIRTATPIFDPLDEVYNAPVFDAAFTILLETPAIDKASIPPELGGHDVQFLFENPVKQAETRLKLASAQEVIQLTAALQPFDPNAPSRIDWDALGDDAVRGTNAPADWFADPEMVAQENQAAANQAQIEQAGKLLQGGAGVAGAVADATQKMQQAGIV